MKTRQDYLDGKVTHREYYAQFVTSFIKSTVESRIGKAKIVHCTDPHFNGIADLQVWESCVYSNPSLVSKLKEVGDGITLAGLVCIAKEAAKQIQEGK